MPAKIDPTSIVVDLWNIRCENCKVALHDELAKVCPACGAPFDRISSNHVGLANRLERRRANVDVDVQRSP